MFIHMRVTDDSSVLESGSIWIVWGWLLRQRGNGIVMIVIQGGAIQLDRGGREREREFGYPGSMGYNIISLNEKK